MTKYHHILFATLVLILLVLFSFSCNNPTTSNPQPIVDRSSPVPTVPLHDDSLTGQALSIRNPETRSEAKIPVYRDRNSKLASDRSSPVPTVPQHGDSLTGQALSIRNPVTPEPGNLVTYNPQLATPNPQLPMTPSKDMLLGRLDPAGDDDFLLIDIRYASREGMYMRKEAYEAFLEMHAAAASDGIRLTIISAMRTFNHQKRIWENKWNGRQMLYGNIRATKIDDPVERALEILRFSAMPGTSRHHWGTDIDINNLNNSYFASGQGKKEYDWLVANAERFGFCQPYTAHGATRVGGYEEEKWHWSYEPVSSQYLRAYMETISYDDIKGFDGWETAAQIDVISGYVMAVGCGK